MASRELGFWKFIAIMIASAIGYGFVFMLILHVLRLIIFV